MSQNNYLIIGGSTKCGTTSVFNYFEFHPEICACTMKESRYFWTNDYPLEATARVHQKVNSFEDLFGDCNKNRVRLEATPDYLYSVETAKKIKTCLPNCKMVFILRDPVERLISWYKFAQLNGLIEKSVLFNEYVKLQEKNSNSNLPQHLRSLEQGKYAEHLKTYIEIFGRENVLITFYEDLAADPLSFCTKISNFTGINADYFKTYEFKVFNRSVGKRSVGAHKLFRKFKRTIRPATRLLHDSLRKRLKLAGYNLEKAYTSANSDGNNNIFEMDSEMRKHLITTYTNDVNQIKQLTGIIPPWNNFS